MGPELLGKIVAEMSERLTGGMISKVHQPSARDIVLKVLAGGREVKLLVSAHHTLPRIYITEEPFENPPAPPRFAQFLRSRITGAVIEWITRPEGERIVSIGLKKGRGEDAVSYTLIAELTGKSSNIILVDSTGVILEALRHFPVEGSIRPVEPGFFLEPLPSGPGAPKELLIERREGEGWCAAAERHYSSLIKEEGFGRERARLGRIIAQARKKAEKKLKNLLGDRERAEREKDFQRLGDLLVANFSQIKRGLSSIEAVDYTVIPPEKVRVEIDPKLSPKENVDKYFKRARKAKAAIALLAERIPQTEREIEYIKNLSFEAEDSETPDDLALIEDELLKAGYIRKAAPVRKEIIRAEPVKRLRTKGGLEVLLGKTGAGNDLIVKKYAADEDVWLHASGVPGAHVLIKSPGKGREIPIEDMEEAASLAAWHSKAREETKAEVVYAEAKNVKKPKGAPPGLVTVSGHRSIRVRPREME